MKLKGQTGTTVGQSAQLKGQTGTKTSEIKSSATHT
jgi:hypothetical protein